jgi:hypothetical protein
MTDDEEVFVSAPADSGARPAARVSAEFWSKLHCFNLCFRRMMDAKTGLRRFDDPRLGGCP